MEFRILLIAEGIQGIKLCCAAGWEKARQQSDDETEDDDIGESPGIAGFDALNQARHQASGTPTGEQTNGKTNEYQQDWPRNLRRPG